MKKQKVDSFAKKLITESERPSNYTTQCDKVRCFSCQAVTLITYDLGKESNSITPHVNICSCGVKLKYMIEDIPSLLEDKELALANCADNQRIKISNEVHDLKRRLRSYRPNVGDYFFVEKVTSLAPPAKRRPVEVLPTPFFESDGTPNLEAKA